MISAWLQFAGALATTPCSAYAPLARLLESILAVLGCHGKKCVPAVGKSWEKS